MTTPHAPEGGEVQRWQMWCEFSHAHRPQKHPDGAFVEYADHVMALHAAYDRGATAERERVVGMASEEDREMVQHYGYLATEAHRANCSGEACCEAPDRRDANKAEAEALALILARLAAARGEALEEAARVCDVAVTELHLAAQRAQGQGNSELMCSREDKADCAEGLARRIRALSASPASGASTPRGPGASTGTGVGNG